MEERIENVYVMNNSGLSINTSRRTESDEQEGGISGVEELIGDQ